MARIVIVDDSLLIRTLLREILTGAHHQVLGDAGDGVQAESQVRRLRPDLVTLDLVMPVRGGLDAIPHLLSVEPSLAVVVCSASLDQRRVIAALRLGAIGFIIKPFDRASVLANIDNALHSLAPATHPTNTISLQGLPAAGQSLDVEDEHRDFQRVPAELLVRITPVGGQPTVTTTVDVSGNGVLLAAGQIAVGTPVDFHLQLGSGLEAVKGRARVARIDGAGRPALTFEQVSVDDHERLIAHIHGCEPNLQVSPA